MNQNLNLKRQEISRGRNLRNPRRPPRIVPSGHNVIGVDERASRVAAADPNVADWCGLTAGNRQANLLHLRPALGRNLTSAHESTQGMPKTPLACGGGDGWPRPDRFAFFLTRHRATRRLHGLPEGALAPDLVEQPAGTAQPRVSSGGPTSLVSSRTPPPSCGSTARCSRSSTTSGRSCAATLPCRRL